MKSYDELKSLIEKRGVHDVFGAAGEGWFIEQNSHELAMFLVAMQELGVTSVLEIGTGWRAGLARFLSEDMGWRVVSLDRNMPVSPAPLVEFYMGRSEILRPLFDGWHFDLVIIDADHSYEAVKRDHEMYAELATKAVMFHDIAGLRDCEGAKRYWAYIKGIAQKEGYGDFVREIIAEGDQRGGIGWLDIETLRQANNAGQIRSQPLYRAGDAVHAPVGVEQWTEILEEADKKTDWQHSIEAVTSDEEMTAPEKPKRKRTKKAAQ